MARSRSYDDMSDDRVSKRGGSPTKILLIVILLSVLICVGAVLVWLKILELNPEPEPVTAVAETVAETPVAPPQTQEEPVREIPEETVAEAEKTPDLSIDSGISALAGASSEEEKNVASTEEVPETKEKPVVFEESVEMKKPAIAQNLSISQQSFAKDIVKYQEYEIQPDDSLMTIAESFGLSVQTIVAVNMIKSTKDLWIGKVLRIPDRDGTLYVVGEGDTLLSITQQMGLAISPKTLGDVNGILEDNLNPGQKLFIPYETLETEGTISASSEPVFALPSEGKVVGLFNTKVVNPLGDNSIQLDGVLLQSEPGAKVLASESGTVVDKGFNENGTQFVKIMHQGGYTSFYDYLGEVYVDTADNVSKGQEIGSYAQSLANYYQPIIFFKIEQGGVAFDPQSFLN
ncbi:MAG: LysM peptidoglycan-binding domain-containing protein [Spirochaetales bacterium]|nr:LysM peptidoglycan-binding domain-containing protein [Spirochaetales bacterium]